MSEFWKLITVFFFSSVKFLPAIITAKAMSLPFWKIIIVSTAGGCLGVFVFYYLYAYLIILYRERRKNKTHEHPKPRTKKIFTKANRRKITMVNKYGLIGIAFFTPFILSLPVGMFLAARLNLKFIQNTPKVLTSLCVSVLLWSLFLTTILDFIPVPDFLK